MTRHPNQRSPIEMAPRYLRKRGDLGKVNPPAMSKAAAAKALAEVQATRPAKPPGRR